MEQPILLHPSVLVCAVVGVPADEQGGEEEVCLFVVAKEGKAITEQQISDWASERLPAFLNPRYIRVMDGLPTTPSGKIQKSKLRELDPKLAWQRG